MLGPEAPAVADHHRPAEERLGGRLEDLRETVVGRRRYVDLWVDGIYYNTRLEETGKLARRQ